MYRNLCCYECPIYLCIEDDQTELCGCDKVQGEFCTSGLCEDAYVEPHHSKRNSGNRKTGYTYRREMKIKKDRKTTEISAYGYYPNVGYPKHIWIDEYWICAGYLQYPKNSKRQGYLKRQSNKIVRQSKDMCGKGSRYKRSFDYWWNLY